MDEGVSGSATHRICSWKSKYQSIRKDEDGCHSDLHVLARLAAFPRRMVDDRKRLRLFFPPLTLPRPPHPPTCRPRTSLTLATLPPRSGGARQRERAPSDALARAPSRALALSPSPPPSARSAGLRRRDSRRDSRERVERGGVNLVRHLAAPAVAAGGLVACVAAQAGVEQSGGFCV